MNVGRYSASCCTFDSKYIYVFGGRSNYGEILSSIEMIDTEFILASVPRMQTSWKLLKLTLPFCAYDIFSQQIDSGTVLIMGGKTNTSKYHRLKAYKLNIELNLDSSQLIYTLHELEDINGKE